MCIFCVKVIQRFIAQELNYILRISLKVLIFYFFFQLLKNFNYFFISIYTFIVYFTHYIQSEKNEINLNYLLKIILVQCENHN